MFFPWISMSYAAASKGSAGSSSHRRRKSRTRCNYLGSRSEGWKLHGLPFSPMTSKGRLIQWDAETWMHSMFSERMMDGFFLEDWLAISLKIGSFLGWMRDIHKGSCVVPSSFLSKVCLKQTFSRQRSPNMVQGHHLTSSVLSMTWWFQGLSRFFWRFLGKSCWQTLGAMQNC